MSHQQDPNELVTCPFDKSHQIAAHRLHTHILKCKKSHPELDMILETCPFNFLHRFLPHEKEQHLLSCIDNHRILRNKPTTTTTTTTTTLVDTKTASSYEKRPIVNVDDEDWDNESVKQEIFEQKPDLNRISRLDRPNRGTKNRKNDEYSHNSIRNSDSCTSSRDSSANAATSREKDGPFEAATSLFREEKKPRIDTSDLLHLNNIGVKLEPSKIGSACYTRTKNFITSSSSSSMKKTTLSNNNNNNNSSSSSVSSSFASSLSTSKRPIALGRGISLRKHDSSK